jgi:FSR family fosmidomycin resistance protein-like MFS transporter
MLWLCGLLHALTHMYGIALIPLYLFIRSDFDLASDAEAAALVTTQGLAYFLPSYFFGILADKLNRRVLLAMGLLINSLAFIALAYAPSFQAALFCVVLAGIGGGFFHPSATALVARLFPTATGKALGQVGIGAGVGFFVGPLYCGWRAESSGWRAPIFELGAVGLIAAIVFWFLSEDDAPIRRQASRDSKRLFPTWHVAFSFLAVCAALGFRDFAGGGIGTLSSLFLQRGRGFDAATTGLALGAMSLMAIISNPLFGGLSDRNRGLWIFIALFTSACIASLLPWLPNAWLVPCLLAYGFFFMASFPMIEAAIMELVPDAVRGRVVGVSVMIGGTISSFSHWSVGTWLKSADTDPSRYFQAFTFLALFILISVSVLPCLRLLGRTTRNADGQNASAHCSHLKSP